MENHCNKIKEKIIVLVMCCIALVGVTGCDNNETGVKEKDKVVGTEKTGEVDSNKVEKEPKKGEYTLELNKTFKLNDPQSHNLYLSEITLQENNGVFKSVAGINAGGSSYTGTYTITDNTLTIILTKMTNVAGEWENLPEEAQNPRVYKIIENNKFTVDGQDDWIYEVSNN